MIPPEFVNLKPETMKIFERLQGHNSLAEALAANPDLEESAVKEAMQDFENHMPEIIKMRDAMEEERQLSKKKKRGKASSNPAAYQIKITLAGSKPPIWRRVLVPENIILEDLSDVILAAMGWDGSHLHGFEIGGEPFDGLLPDGSQPDDKMGWPAWESVLCEEVPAAKSKFRYEYDFGDGWTHQLLVEKIIPASEKPAMYTCTGGKGRCPPEDCGGIQGYYYLLNVLSTPKHPDYESILEWIGDPINPDEFSLEEANDALAPWRG